MSTPASESTPSTTTPSEAQRLGKRRVWPIVVAVIVVVAALGGGLGYYYYAQSQKTSKPSIVFSGWVSSGQEFTFDQQMVSNFNAMHPNVTVTFQPITGNYYSSLQSQFVAGNAPSVFYMENDILPQFAHLGYLANLTPALSANSTYDLAGFEPNVINSFYFHGGLYAAPKDWAGLFVLFNKNIFNTEKVAYPTNLTSWNWTTFTQTLRALKANESMLPGGGSGYYPMVEGAQFARILAFMHEASGQWINQTGDGMAPNSGGLQSAIAYWYGLYSQGLAGLNSNLSAGWNGGDFATGKVGMVVTGNWAVPVLNASGAYFQNQMSAVGYTVMPSDIQKATMMFNVGLALKAGLTGVDQWIAQQFVQYFTGPTGEQTWVSTGLALPSRTAILDSTWYQTTFPIDAMSGSQFPYAYGWNYNTTNFNQAHTDCHNVIANLFAGKITVQQAYAEVIAATNTDLAGTSTG